jgi:hypothetical protein
MAKLSLVKPVKDYAFEINTENDLLNAFPLDDQKKLVLPSKFVFPLRTDHYFSWTSPDGYYAYLVFKKPEWPQPRGVVFRGRNKGDAQSASMCDLCHSFGSANEIGMMLTSVTHKKTIGMMLCLDLNCIDKLETLAAISGRNFEQLAEKVCERLSSFFENTLKRE